MTNRELHVINARYKQVSKGIDPSGSTYLGDLELLILAIRDIPVLTSHVKEQLKEIQFKDTRIKELESGLIDPIPSFVGQMASCYTCGKDLGPAYCSKHRPAKEAPLLQALREQVDTRDTRIAYLESELKQKGDLLSGAQKALNNLLSNARVKEEEKRNYKTALESTQLHRDGLITKVTELEDCLERQAGTIRKYQETEASWDALQIKWCLRMEEQQKTSEACMTELKEECKQHKESARTLRADLNQNKQLITKLLSDRTDLRHQLAKRDYDSSPPSGPCLDLLYPGEVNSGVDFTNCKSSYKAWWGFIKFHVLACPLCNTSHSEDIYKAEGIDWKLCKHHRDLFGEL